MWELVGVLLRVVGRGFLWALRTRAWKWIIEGAIWGLGFDMAKDVLETPHMKAFLQAKVDAIMMRNALWRKLKGVPPTASETAQISLHEVGLAATPEAAPEGLYTSPPTLPAPDEIDPLLQAYIARANKLYPGGVPADARSSAVKFESWMFSLADKDPGLLNAIVGVPANNPAHIPVDQIGQ